MLRAISADNITELLCLETCYLAMPGYNRVLQIEHILLKQEMT